MKFAAVVLLGLLALGALPSPALAEDRTITKVVKLLQGMLEKSKVDGDADRVIFAKFQCYCDTKTATKTKEIDELTKQIAVLESEIQDLLGSTGELSVAVALLQKQLAENEQVRNEAQALRTKENESFEALSADLNTAIGQMGTALNTLSEVGADQTLASASDHSKFMAGYKPAALLKLRGSVSKALTAASALLGESQRQKVVSLLQAPFTGSYSSQSGEVVGILKNMRDTFTSNLAAATAAETAQQAAYSKFSSTKLAEKSQLEALYAEKQDQLGANDGALATKRAQKEDAEAALAIRQEFLSQLGPLCQKKAAEYKERTLLRGNEDAALSEAISILNSDAAFATFGTTAAATSGATGAADFLQRSAVRRHVASAAEVVHEASRRLRQAAGSDKSLRLMRIVAMLEAENPFAVILEQIEKVVALLEKEGVSDKEKLDWCNAEREASNTAVAAKVAQITELEAEITTLTNDIESPETGLKAQLAATEAALVDNADDQRAATSNREAENAAFLQNVKDLASAEDLLSSAIKVLTKYYASLDAYDKPKEEATVLAGEEEAHAGTWEGEGGYQGQSESGSKAIEMLEYILSETQKEEAEARQAEADALAEYDALMAELKTAEAGFQSFLAALKKSLAETESSRLSAQESLKNTENEKSAVEQYLADIKPGCDFITAHFDGREESRAAEKTSLFGVVDFIKGTPAYKAAVAAAHVESLGDCAGICKADEEHVNCKACLAKVTVPGYCAGHPDTEGC